MRRRQTEDERKQSLAHDRLQEWASGPPEGPTEDGSHKERIHGGVVSWTDPERWAAPDGPGARDTDVQRAGGQRRRHSEGERMRGGNVVSFAHERLTTWGDRREALGTPSEGPLARVALGSITAAASRPQGTHGDATIALQIRDERVYACEKAIEALSLEDEQTAGVLVGYYVRKLRERDIATYGGISRRQVEESLLSGRSWVGCYLMMHRDKVKADHDVPATGTG